VAKALPPARGYHLLTIRFWSASESIYDSRGRVDPGYHPNPDGATLLSGLAAATGGKAFSEGQLGAAASTLTQLAGTGPSAPTGEIVQSQQPLAPFLAGAAALALLTGLLPLARLRRLPMQSRRAWRSRSAEPNTAFEAQRM
jgi:hypothetical protein